MNRQIVIVGLPEEHLTADHFRMTEAPIPRPGPGEVLCRTLLVSLDPVHRLHMRSSSYRGGLAPGDVMAGFSLSEVVDPGDCDLPIGTIVSAEAGWQDYAALPRTSVVPIQVQAPLSHHMSVLGITGMTGWFGMTKIGGPRPGETVVVSAAAGATGNVAGQIARHAGARVVGIAGSEEKRRLLEDQLGFAATVDHRSECFSADLRAACPDGIDVYFDNVGGHVLDAALAGMNPHGRVVCCGVLASYDAATPQPGPRAVPGLVISKRLRLEGFVVLDHVEEWPSAQSKLSSMVNDGDLAVLEHVAPSLEDAPEAFLGVLAGRNVGKWMVRVGQPSNTAGELAT